MVETAMLNGANIIDELTEMEKDIFNRENLFMKYVNDYVYFSKDVPEEKLTALAEKYNNGGIVIKVIENFDEHHNAKKDGNTFQMSDKLQQISEEVSTLSDGERTNLVNENSMINAYISENKAWQKELEAATEALMYTIQELV